MFVKYYGPLRLYEFYDNLREIDTFILLLPFLWHFPLLLSEGLNCFIYTDPALSCGILLLLYILWKDCFPILFLGMPCYSTDKLLIFVFIAFVNFRL